MILHLNEHTLIPIHSEMFVPSFLQRKETFKKKFKPLPYTGVLYLLNSLWKGCGPSNEQTWIASLCVKLSWNSLDGSGENVWK